jgi:neopullulanase
MKKFLLIVLMFVSTTIFAQIQQICPPNWWIGMQDSSVQLMIHGNNIGAYQLSINYPGVKLVSSTSVENANYLFADLVIDENTKPGLLQLQFKDGKSSFSFSYELKSREKRTFAYGLDASDFIYLLMPDRFANGDMSNDIVEGMQENTMDRNNPKGRHGGDLAGIIQHLDDIKELGSTATWCTPLFTNDQPKWSYHGYAATDHYAIDPRYGNSSLFKSYVDESHKRDLKVVVDIVHNHVGAEHWFIKDLPMADWIHQWDTTALVKSNYRTSVKHDPYGSEFDKKKMNEGWFDGHMPDLNQDNKFLSEYIIQNNIWLIENYHIDGFRLDTYPYSDLDFLVDWAAAVENEYPGFGVFGEVWVNGVGVQGYFHGNNKLNTGYNSGLPGVTDFNLYDAVTSGFNEGFGWYNGVTRIYHNLSQDYLYGDVMKNVLFLSNHDISRIYSVLGEDMNKLKMAIAFTLTTRGMVQWYYGDEIGMKNFSHPEDGKVREDYPGGWPADGIDKFSNANLNAQEKEIYNYVQTIALWRKNSAAIKSGKLMQFIPENGVYVYFRYTDTETIMVILNTDKKAYTPDVTRFAERLNGFNSATDIVTGTTTNGIANIKVEGMQSGIYILNRR